ncbi:hypothetical protein OQ519_25215 [Pseudomonas lurida]|uniref:hypothetical protein n=1 Tax=Pseudomonas lurida TaxID=244566 RepID=UPI0017804E18|nr:hypothetical protein [Pseudomonas lurida]MBD8669820.1 hypothetical protein [Pseudomonas lurida]UZQ74174.1 hypothetical protein OQ519_25215 [Pseudomonas lurida]
MSSDKRSVLLHQSASTESMGFDRFVLGATLAACAYLAQTIPFAPVGHNIETMYLWTLVVMAAAALLGFKRIEAVIETVKFNSQYLADLETGKVRTEQINHLYQTALEKRSRRTLSFYRARNTALFMSFACYVATKVFATYLI